MKTGVCPKCGSNEVYMRRRMGDKDKTHLIPLGDRWRQRLAPDTYICADCGYVEYYVIPGDMQKVAVNWQRADGNPKRNRHPDD